MELDLEVVLSSSIKRKKPWPRFCWLGREKESVFLLDDKRISEINMVSGCTKKKTPKLHPLLKSVVTMASSHNGMWLCGLMISGELFLWNRDKDLLKTVASVPEVADIITAVQEMHSSGSSTRLSLQVSGDGMHVLLVAITGQVFLWECMDVRDLMGVRDGTVKGQWVHIQPLESSILPSSQDKEASQHTIFVKTEVMGDACLSGFVFTSGMKLIITCLKIQWEEGPVGASYLKYSIKWATKTYPMSRLTPPCQPVKSRGALVPAFSPDGRLLAIVLNQKQPKATQVLFLSTHNFISVSSGLGGCGSKAVKIPPKYIRSYWVGSVSWSPGGLFLACVLKRGSLLMISRLGGLLTLTSCGCSVDFGPAHFLPLHPLVTFWLPISAGKREASPSSSILSTQDVLRQRYSVTWHPRLLYLIVSDGYMATVMRVLHRPSPALLLTTLLKDVGKDLDKAIEKLDQSQVHARAWLESVSCLNLPSSHEVFNPIVTPGPQTTDSVLSAATDGSPLPLFLQDQETLGGTKELFQKVQTFFQDDSDLEGAPTGSHLEDNGRLEFASMFDTLHAQDTQTDSELNASVEYEEDSVATERKTPLRHREVGKIQSKLLTAWAFGMSLGNIVDNRTLLLRHTLHCVVRFAALLHLIPSSMVHTGKKNTSVSARLLHLLKDLLSFIAWDGTHSDGPRCLGLLVDFSKRLIHLILTPHPQTGHCQLSSHRLSTALRILQQFSDSLNHTYRLQQKNVWASSKKESQPPLLWPSDVHHVPLLQDKREEKASSSHQARPVPQRPSSRLLGVWQWVYKITQQYVEELRSFKDCDGWEEEQHRLSVIMSHIQRALQAAGQRLEEGPALLNYPGEHLFLCGSYPKSADTWRSQICEENNKSCGRAVFKETRLCLALLYNLLSQYRLREAQELGDHMACLILYRAGHQKNITCITDSLPCPWLPVDLQNDAAVAVVQTLGRFMASYFTNQPLYILPAHHVAILPPLHLPHAHSVGRLVPLSQEEVSRAVRQQQLSEVWTVDYAQDLLLLGGLLPESAWLAYHLGDWKTAASLSLAYMNYCSNHYDFSCLRRRELHLPTDLEPESIFQVQLECLLGSKFYSQECSGNDGGLSLTEPLEGEECNVLQASIQEILKASVMAGVDVMSSPMSSLLETAKELCSYLTTLVPNGLYLPSPPLYCPQPSLDTQDPVGQFAEVASRHKVSGVLQRLLLLLRSAHCSYPAAQWYMSHLRRARHILHKIKKTYSYPSTPEEEKAFPEGLMKFITHSGFFRQGPKKCSPLDPHSIQTIICFRELCGLCWMLHVRDQLSISCRKYQAARQHGRDGQVPAGSEMIPACVGALCWVRRFLPFSRFLNAEEMVQDMLLSLLSELPPFTLVADTLAQAFPEEEESVRVPLREKYNSLLQRLRQCNALEGEEEEANEPMVIVIQDRRRLRRKHLGRLQRHLAPPELHLWEKEEKEEDRGSKHGLAMLRPLSLGTSLSTSTLTDCRFPAVCSDGGTPENTSEAKSPEMQSGGMARGKKAKKVREDGKKNSVKTKQHVTQKESQSGDAEENEQPSLPVVGTWEFELEDEEYLNFLELFLGYVLGRDTADGGHSGCELPLLRSFSSRLRERELHSLNFDVLTTIHRRQSDAYCPTRKHSVKDPPVFRAGCCYKPSKPDVTPEQQTSSVWSEAPAPRAGQSVSSLPGLRTGRQKGLFGLRQQSIVPLGQRMNGSLFDSETSPIRNASPIGQPSESFILGSPTSVEVMINLQQGLDPKFEAQFPELGRLLEWMVRWADRRVLFRHRGKKKNGEGGVFEGKAVEGVVIRIKASTPAILTSLSLMQHRHSAPLWTDRNRDRIQVPATQCTVAPVLQPEVGPKLERESSVDTSNPRSANRANAGPDHNVQQEELSKSSTDEPEEETLLQTPLPNEQNQLTSDAQQTESSSQQPSFDHLEVAPEKEGSNDASGGLEVSSVSNESIAAHICTPVTSLKLASLDFSEKAEEASRSTFLHSHAQSPQTPPHPEPQALPTVRAETEVRAELSGSVAELHPNPPVDSPSLQPQNSVAGATAADFIAPHQPLSTQTPPMRQRLGEDLFRLVQNIHYMSLTEVLGASFSNLHLAQRSSSLAQSDMNSLHPNMPSPFATNIIPQPHALPMQTNMSVTSQTPPACAPSSGPTNTPFSQVPATVYSDQTARQSPERSLPTGGQCHITRTLSSTANGTGVNDQEMQPLSVLAVSPEVQFRGSRRLIPPSQGLLATTDISHSAPASAPSNASLQNDHASLVLGLKLLQLQYPPLLHHTTALHYPPVQTPRTANPPTIGSNQHQFKRNDQPIFSKQTEDGKRNGSSLSKRQPSFNSSHDPPQPKIQTSERFRGQESPLPQSHITFPKLLLPSSWPRMVIAGPRAEGPKVKLLHIESGPKMMLPMATPRAQRLNLIPMEELTSSVRQSAEEARLQMLRVDSPADRAPRATSSPSSNSSKRQERREKNVEAARKTEVAFRPNDSIISIKEPTNQHGNEEPAAAEEITSRWDAAIPFVPGSFDSSLTGQRLLDKAISTSAELHAFASTSKRPPECHDAFTNTDPACPPLVDKVVSASVTSSGPESQHSGILQFCIEGPVKDTQTRQGPETNLDPEGHQFISVLDLEDKDLHHDLPHRLSPGAPDVPLTHPSSPTSAQLHVLATSVLRAAAADVQPIVTIPEDLTAHTDIPEELPSLSHTEPDVDPVRITPQDMDDPSDPEICRAIKTLSVGPHRAPFVPPTAWFSSRLSELMAQLDALQNIADHLEGDFSNSRMLVNTIEKPTPVLTPDVKTTSAVKKTVRLSVPEEAWMPRLDDSTEPNAVEMVEDNQEDESAVHDDSCTPEWKPSFHYSTSSHSDKAGPSYLHTRTKTRGQPVETPETSPGMPDENLSQTGLSDTAEILDELVREGYLSLADLDCPSSQPALRSRPDQQESSWMSQRQPRAEDERRELRIWMRRKGRERLAAYQKHRGSLREKEHKPFSTSGTAKPSNKNRTTIWKTREEKEKFMLLENYNQRTRDAWSLATDFPTNPPTRLNVSSAARSNSAPRPDGTHSDRRSSKSGQAHPHFRPWTAEMQWQTSEDHHRRLGLHRPVTSPPRDCLSQVTRRGMLTDTRSHSKLSSASQSEERHVGFQTKMGLNTNPSGGTAAGKGTLREQTKIEEREEVTARLLNGTDDGAKADVSDMDWAGVSDMDWPDYLSDTGSRISKMDWAAIEKIVAEEEEEEEA